MESKEKIAAASKKFGNIPVEDMNSKIRDSTVLDICAVTLSTYGEMIDRRRMESTILATNNTIEMVVLIFLSIEYECIIFSFNVLVFNDFAIAGSCSNSDITGFSAENNHQ